ncbi:hypothetical protein RJT34_31207 [Clitoria ternatea]|uniref:Uncharacterized protein n=1 Tax=Clitoria ternatea TaxID=43366 RepID=A0AAN9EV31_CLITE
MYSDVLVEQDFAPHSIGTGIRFRMKLLLFTPVDLDPFLSFYIRRIKYIELNLMDHTNLIILYFYVLFSVFFFGTYVLFSYNKVN